ncbi:MULTISPECIES: MMPL family transporter [Thiomicrorhabdus]|uniref:MMPL family transporter n=1 Tax=Thiomicrorhabdus heinhorstiae TaxID=2748010 RepID=A0ABS0BSV2_9GAMM|nr:MULTISPECIES: MMPL family transporter [Thiomicrorhabdus]MBF6056932.1 MMPL family transporter [Thiomicrorhabdus heinhorstiae]
MGGSWAFNWVQIMAHNRNALVTVWTLISLIIALGNFFLDWQPLQSQIGLLLLSVIAMSLAVAYLLESPKAAMVQLLVSLYSLAMSFGILGWLGIELDNTAVLGIVVVITLMTSNLVHIMSGLLREMARGLFQYDAIAEALKLNAVPVLLSNLTTALGFIAAAYFESAFSSLAWLVGIGVLVSYLVALSWLPMLLLNWLLEFRVGNTADRHGLNSWSEWLQHGVKRQQILLWMSVVIGIGLIVFAWQSFDHVGELFILATIFWFLFAIYWKSLRLAVLNIAMNLVALLLTLSLFYLFNSTAQTDSQLSLLLMMMPLGLIVDDGIHFFSRYARAQNSFFSDPISAVKFALASVGRAIWVTSWILFVGLAVLVFSGNTMVWQSSLITILALAVSTLLILAVVPAMLMAFGKAGR